MELALHAPGLGYYSAGARKFGIAGDFVTAPELGSLFARTLARQAAQILHEGVASIVELGAGSGRLARDLLAQLATLECLPQRYVILETSADLRECQRSLLQRELPRLAPRISWLDALPASLDALVIGNEVLDAMPVHVVKTRANGIDELGVTVNGGKFEWSAKPAAGAVLTAATGLNLAPCYATEIHLAAHALVRSLAASLIRGAALLIDYGFPAREYYHPQRTTGTLMCHYRHHAHADPLCLVGSAGHHRARRFQRDRPHRCRSRARSARLYQSGAVFDQLRHHRCAGCNARAPHLNVPAACGAGAKADESGGNG